jgi:cobalt/nickel transport system permease protein
MFDRSPVRLFACSPVRLFACSPVRLFACSPVRLFDCSIVLMAHIPDGFLSAPVIAGAAAASATALAVAARRSRDTLGERETTLLGATTAFVFAAQLLNFPLGVGTSAHLMGGVLVAVLVGPWAGMLVMFSVLLVQALLFQDGGIAALGANTLNVAVIGVGGGYVIYWWLLALFGAGLRGRIAAGAGAAYLSTLLVGASVAVELVISGIVPVGPATLVILGGYLLVGVGEAVLTGAILGVLARAQPQLLVTREPPSTGERGLAYAIAVVSAGLAVAAVYVASARPDMLEAAATRLGIESLAQTTGAAPFPDYTSPVGAPWVAAAVGVVAVFIVVWLLSRLATRIGRS